MAVTPYPGIDLADAMVTTPTALGDWLIVVPIAVPIVAGALLLMLRHSPRLQAPVALGALAFVILADLLLLGRVLADGPLAMTMGGWLPPFGISFVADPLGVILALTGAIVAFVCAMFGIEDIDADGRRYGFYPFLLLLTAGVSGSFLTGDIFNLYVWFEIFLISSFGLIVLGSTPTQLDGAVKYAVLNLVGTTLFLLTTGLLYGVFGTLNMADIARKAPEIRETGPLMTLAVLYLVAFGMKAAAFPLSFWLPASYHTPRIVVAALFGGLLTKVGVYALLRSLVMLFPLERAALGGLIGWIAIATMLLGILGALAQSDVRRILGFIVVSGIGVMLAGLALGTGEGISGTVVYAVHSMLVMTALYVLAGMVGRLGGSFSLHQLGGLYRNHPMLAAIALLLVLSIAGLPPGSGLWPKVMLVKASLDGGQGLLAFAILATGLLTSLALGRVFALAFWRPAAAVPGDAQVARASRLGYLSLGLLLLPILWIGIYPDPVIQVADRAAAELVEVSGYVDTVFPQGDGE